MESLLINLLNPDKSLRESSEAQLEEIKQSNPFDFHYSLLKIFQSFNQENIKLLCLVILRQSLTKTWDNFSSEQRTVIKDLLLGSLSFSESWNVSRNSGFCVSGLAIFIVQSESGEKWSNFLSFLLKSLKSSNIYVQYSAFLILAEIVPFFAETFSKLKQKLIIIFLKNLESPYPDICRVVIHSFTTFISVINTSETLNYTEILKPLLESIQRMCLEFPDYGEDCLKSLIELSETEPYYFRSDLALCYSFVETLIRKVSIKGLKVNILEFIVILIEKHSTLIYNSKEILAGTCEIIFEVLSEECISIYENLEINIQKHVIALLRRTIEAIGESIVDYCLRLCEALLTERRDEMNYFSLLMVLGEIAGYIYNTEKFLTIHNAVHIFGVSEFTSLRWASFRIVSKLLDVNDSDFQLRFHLSVLPLLFKGLSDDQEIIILKVLKACKRFLQNNDKEISKKYSPDLIPFILSCLDREGCTKTVLENLMILCEINRENISNFFAEIFLKLKSLLKNSPNIIRASVLDCILHLRKIIPKSEFLNLTNEYILIINYLQDFTDDDLQLSCLKSVAILSKYLKSNFTSFLPFFIPNILRSIVTVNTQQIETYLEVLLSLIDSTRGGYLQYLDKTSELILVIMKCEISKKLKILTCKIASSLVNVITESGNQEFISLIEIYSRGFLNEIHKILEKENDSQYLIEIFKSINQLLSSPGYEFLTDEEIIRLGETTWSHLVNQKNTYFKCDELFNAELLIISALFKFHAGSGVLDYIFKKIQRLFGSNEEEAKIFGVILCRVLLESVGVLMSLEKVEEIAKVFIYYSEFPNHQVKKQCFYGISAIACNVSVENFIRIGKTLLCSLENTLNNLQDCKNNKDVKTKDLVLITIGKIIKYRFDCLAGELIVTWWTCHLPVTSHKTQAKEIHDFLADLILNHLPSLMNTEKFILLFIGISYTELCGNVTLPKIKKILEIFIEGNSIEGLYGITPGPQKMKIQKILNNF